MKTKLRYNEINIATEFKALKELWRAIEEEFDLNSGRKENVIRYRHSAIVAMRKHGNLSVTDIGAIFNRDHSSVSHAWKKHHKNEAYKYDKNYAGVYQQVESLVIDCLVEFNLRHPAVDTSSLDLTLNEELKKLRTYAAELEDKLSKATSELSMKEIGFNKLLDQLKISQSRNEELNKLATRYKNLI